jgi:hypothetical protein
MENRGFSSAGGIPRGSASVAVSSILDVSIRNPPMRNHSAPHQASGIHVDAGVNGNGTRNRLGENFWGIVAQCLPMCFLGWRKQYAWVLSARNRGREEHKCQ